PQNPGNNILPNPSRSLLPNQPSGLDYGYLRFQKISIREIQILVRDMIQRDRRCISCLQGIQMYLTIQVGRAYQESGIGVNIGTSNSCITEAIDYLNLRLKRI